MRLAGCRWMPWSRCRSSRPAGWPARLPPRPPPRPSKTYVVDGVRDSLDRSAVVATGAAIVEVDHASVIVTASPSDVRKLRKLGRYRVTRYVAPKAKAKGGLQARAAAFPAADSNYHDYGEMTAETAAIAAAYPSLVSR